MAVETRGPELLVITAVMLAFSIVSIVLRVYVRLGMVKAFGLDDWFMVAAAVCRQRHSWPNDGVTDYSH